MTGTTMLPPVVRTLSLRCSPDTAFDVFTEQIGQWWPSGFTASGHNLADVVIEAKVGGRVYEVNNDGETYDWGAVTVWEPGRRVVQSWTLGLDRSSTTEVELRFSGEGDTCEVSFEHRGWRADQRRDRAKFDATGGWDVILDAYQLHAEKQR
jgi:Activator of Hsp90 ATPase homolog 1-like protein